MSSNAAEISKFPDMSLFFRATVPSDDFRTAINHLLQQELPLQVKVDIKDNTATVRVGSDNNSRTANYAMLRGDGCRAMEEGESYSTIFQWNNADVAETLKKAIELDAEFLVLFHAGRHKNIILRFSVEDMGYLEFMRDSAVIVSSTHSKNITRT
ncbi:uncharacterized protein LOC141596101 [Silene latifolia]|uniref:uncharacterized protein LOC141596101 n=1 Tax=Silene latifolia TaxID=37657 RepID=UPI003D78243E